MRSSNTSTTKNLDHNAMYGHTFITDGGLAYNMDAIHYTKIADKLMQFRGKLPKDTHLITKVGQSSVEVMRYKIDDMLNAIEWMAKLDDQGLIR